MDQNYNNGFNGFNNQNNEPQPVDYTNQYNQYEQPQQMDNAAQPYQQSQPVDYSAQYAQYNQPNQINNAPYQPQQAEYTANSYDAQPQQYNEPYYNQQYPTYTEPQNNGKKGMGIASLVLGIVSTVLCCCCTTPITGIIGIVLGIISLKKENTAKGLAIAGIILSAIGIVTYIILTVIGLVNGTAGVSYDSYYNDILSELYGNTYY